MSSVTQQGLDIPIYIFGEASTLSRGEASTLGVSGAPAQIWFILLAASIAALYLMWLNHWSTRNRNNHKLLFRLLGYMRRDYIVKLGETTPSFGGYTLSGTIIGLVTIWIIVLSMGSFSSTGSLALGALIFAGIVACYLYQIIITYIIGGVIGAIEFSKVVNVVKNISYSMVGILVAPVALCYTLSNGKSQEVFVYIIGLQLIIIAILYIQKIFILFLSKKVSLLHTILYLCAVEIFPISLIWGFFHR